MAGTASAALVAAGQRLIGMAALAIFLTILISALGGVSISLAPLGLMAAFVGVSAVQRSRAHVPPAFAAQIELADNAPDASEIAALESGLAKNANDHQARHDLAVALAAAGRKEEAVDHLLTIIRKDRNWNDDAARKQLVQLFEAWGPADEWTLAGRRRLSSILFS